MKKSTSSFNDPLSSVFPSERKSDKLSRREFIKLAGVGGALFIASTNTPLTAFAAESNSHVLNAYVEIRTDGSIRIYAPNPEIGQGVKTSLPMIVAEELDADWQQVTIENSPVNGAIYGRQVAGGSRSIPTRWDELRSIGAATRHMLMQAAASKWNVPIQELSTQKSTVKHVISNKSAHYGELVAIAAHLPIPSSKDYAFKQPNQYQLLGKRITGTDNQAIVTGQALFGIDTRVPGMLYACYVKCPTIGGKAVSANLDEIRTLSGIRDAFILPGTVDITGFDPQGISVASGVAIVADSTWQALKARKQLQVKWDTSKASNDSWNELEKQALAYAKSAGATVLKDKGNVEHRLNSADKTVRSMYTFGFVSHAQLEPQNCVASWQDGSIEVWAPSQTPTAAVSSLAQLLNISSDHITVHQIRAGGGFGRRLDNDYVREAALISQKINAPVKLQWTREDDMAFDFFRVGGFFSLAAGINKKGELSCWDNHVIAMSTDGEKPNSGAGLRDIDFPEKMLKNYRATQTLLKSKTPTGPWRAPSSNTYAFAEQSFVHELATAAGRDHREFLIDLLGEPKWLKPGNDRSLNTARAINTIESVAKRAEWGKSMPKGRALGLSFYFSHAGHVAEIADVSVDSNKKITVHKVWVVADIGTVVNLSGAENQCQGSIIDAISTLMAQEITMQNGRIEQSNFHQYPLLRIQNRPEIDIHFLDSEYSPTGIGEPAFPPAAAAICNAIYSATGERIRTLPISKLGYSI
jgi:isoquinoline 1-oxidoreductase beta subunit